MDSEGTLADDPLFLACTRPAMIAGVTIEAMALTGMVTMAGFIGSGSFWVLGFGVLTHLGCRQIVRHDHNAFRILLAWLETRGRCRNGLYWAGSTVTPVPLGRPQGNARGHAHAR
jgi:type IV secretion system protein VirB3